MWLLVIIQSFGFINQGLIFIEYDIMIFIYDDIVQFGVFLEWEDIQVRYKLIMIYINIFGYGFKCVNYM